MLLKIMINVCDALEYANSNYVLHLHLAPAKIIWSVQDLIETQIYRLANPLSRNGVMVTEFGNLLTLEMQNQNYGISSFKSEMEYIRGYW